MVSEAHPWVWVTEVRAREIAWTTAKGTRHDLGPRGEDGIARENVTSLPKVFKNDEFIHMREGVA